MELENIMELEIFSLSKDPSDLFSEIQLSRLQGSVHISISVSLLYKVVLSCMSWNNQARARGLS
jgi:hypothetical protein